MQAAKRLTEEEVNRYLAAHHAEFWWGTKKRFQIFCHYIIMPFILVLKTGEAVAVCVSGFVCVCVSVCVIVCACVWFNMSTTTALLRKCVLDTKTYENTENVHKTECRQWIANTFLEEISKKNKCVQSMFWDVLFLIAECIVQSASQGRQGSWMKLVL